MPSNLEQLRTDLCTVVGITVTPFLDNGQIDEDTYRALVSRAVGAGVSVMTPNGNTSEFYSLSPSERRRGVELTLESVGDALVLAGVGLDLDSAVSDMLHYRELGARAIMIHQPVLPFWSTEGWVEYHRIICSAAPDMGVVPYIRDPRITLATIKRLLDVCPNIIGIKYAIENPAEFSTIVNEIGNERVTWICGVAETWAPFFAAGGSRGFTSGLVSVDARRSLRMLDDLNAGDYPAAMSEWAEVKEFELLRARGASEFNVSVVKEALAQLGLCRRDVRPPLSLLPQSDRDTVTRILASWALPPSRTGEAA